MGRLDRYGEPIEALPIDDDLHDKRCVDGWLGEDERGAVIPCYRCRPWLQNRHLRKRIPPTRKRRTKR